MPVWAPPRGVPLAAPAGPSLDGDAVRLIVRDAGGAVLFPTRPRRNVTDLTLRDLAVAYVQAEQAGDDVGREIYGEMLYRFRRFPELLCTYYVCVYCDGILRRSTWTAAICTDCWVRLGIKRLAQDFAAYWRDVDDDAALAALPTWLPIARAAEVR